MRIPLPVAVLLLGAAGASTVEAPAGAGVPRAGATNDARDGAATGGLAAPRTAATHTVEIRDFAFSPARLDIAAGDTVVWINRDAAPHTVTHSVGAWDSGELQSGASWSWVAAEPVRFTYLCAYHPSMRGEVRVRVDGSARGRERGAGAPRRP